MHSLKLRVATRRSELARRQTRAVCQALREARPGLKLEELALTTSGDTHRGPLPAGGGKGLFIRELEAALLEGRADLAVHSLKDLPVAPTPGLALVAYRPRADARDALVAASARSLEELPLGARVGTSSLRRGCQLLARRPDLRIVELRGNVDTRLKKLKSGDYDAVVLAAAGLIRLGLAKHISAYLPARWCVPAVGQGAVVVQARAGERSLAELLRQVSHPQTERCVRAEVAMGRELGVDCGVPVGGHAWLERRRLRLRGMVGSPDGQRRLAVAMGGDPAKPEQLGRELAAELLRVGARSLIEQWRERNP